MAEKESTQIWHAADDVRELAKRIIAQYHPHLADAEILYLMRSPAAKSKGKVVLGSAKKASPEHKALHLGPLDLMITLSAEHWKDSTDRARTALLDHELCHFGGNSLDGWEMQGHDVEEFSEIIERHGLWHDGLRETGEVVRQLKLDFDDEMAVRIAERRAQRAEDRGKARAKGKKAFRPPVGGETTMTFSASVDGRPIGEPVTITASEFDELVAKEERAAKNAGRGTLN